MKDYGLLGQEKENRRTGGGWAAGRNITYMEMSQ